MDTKQPEALRIAQERLRALHAENESLREQVQQLGQLARSVNSRRVMELEAQLEAIGAGGVEPLRKRCLHQISEPAKAGWCDGCSPDNCGGCVTPASPAQAGEYPELPVGMPLVGSYKRWFTEEDLREFADATCASRGAAPAAPTHPAVKPDMLVNGGALQLALNVLRRAGKTEVADELAATAAKAAPVDAAKLPSPANVGAAPKCLNLNDQAMWVLGWNECLDAARAAQTGGAA